MKEPRRVLRVGDLATCSSNDLGPGKLIQIGQGRATLEYFDSTADSEEDRHRVEVPVKEVRPYILWPQTRVFFRNSEGDWTSGRVKASDRDQEYLAVKSGPEEVILPPEELYVRWNRSLGDPVKVAIARSFESPFFAERRQPFLSGVWRQRAACRGMSAITSSAIEHHPHQLEAARRVLQDPIQRYLLADEVGLGKTIEAGLILRQLLSDNREFHALIICPPFLVDQWRAEMERKFLIGDFRKALVRFASSDAPESWDSDDGSPDLIIVDEVQRIAMTWDPANPSISSRYHLLADTCHAAPRVLLLSATPVVKNERTFLAMLHLLDRANHPLSDEQGFRDKVGRRKEIGELFFTLLEDTPTFLLDEKIQQLREIFCDDPSILSLADDLESAVANGADTSRFIRQIRVRVGETYRLHRRMIRTRRTGAVDQSFPVAGRSTPSELRASGDVQTRLDQLLNDWRGATLDRLEGATASETEAARLVFEDLVYHALSDSSVLGTWARERAADVSGFSYPPDDAERSVLLELATAARETPEEQTRVNRAVDAVLDNAGGKQRAVVFTCHTEVAKAICKKFEEELGDTSTILAQHIAGMRPELAAAEIERFSDPESRCQILVCDASAEEGRNIQMADVVVHVDLPPSPNRLEQRIGRIDRFDVHRRDEPAASFVLIDGQPGRSLSDSWFKCLRDGFGVFGDSIATLQYTIESATAELWDMVLNKGWSSLGESIEDLRQRLIAERREIAEQDALDAIELVGDELDLAKSLSREEDEWRSFQLATDNLLATESGAPGNLRFVRQIDESGRYCYCIGGNFDLKKVNRMPLVPWDVLFDLQAETRHPGVFDRATAAARSDRTKLFRYGEPLIDALAAYMVRDDKGRCYAIWRYLRDGDFDQEPIYFRLDFRIEANRHFLIGAVKDVLGPEADTTAICRRAEEYFPPVLATRWFDAFGEEIVDEGVLQHLRLPYDKDRGDFNLNVHRRHWLDEVLPQDGWMQTIRKVEAAAREHVQNSLQVEQLREDAKARARSNLSTRIDQLRLRATRGELAARDVDAEAALLDSTVAAVNEPQIDIDCIGVYVLSGRVPEGT